MERLVSDLRAGRNGGVTTGIYTLHEERLHNPFMMVEETDVQHAIGRQDAIQAMQELREAKNQGRLRITI